MAAHGVIDTRGEFRVSTFTGEDDYWAQWSLKFEAWGELLGWGAILDAATDQPNPVDNASLGEDAQAVSRQLYAILVAKLEGKALGIVQLVPKGAGVEAWRQLKLEYEGKSGSRQAALLRSILNPRGGWDKDVKEGKTFGEILNKWERMIGLYRTAAGTDLSDAILAATVVEHAADL